MSTSSCFPIASGRSARCVMVVVAATSLLAGCDKATEKPAAAPPPVTVSRPLARDVIQWDQYSAHLSSPEMSNVQARVSGLIEDAPFKEGAIVAKGEILFELDRRPFQADLDSKQAAVAQAQSALDQAKVHLARYGKVVGTQAISKDDYDSASASSEEAAASLSAAQASLELSRLNLDWTEVRAPIAGRVGRMNVTVGNLVNGGSGQATLLTTIVSINPMYCYIEVPESAALRYQKLALLEKQSNVAGAKIPCFLQLEDETTFSHQGVIDFVDNQVDINTGTVQIRGVFQNPTGLLTPGLFTLMRIPGSGRYRATLIPDVAVNTDQNERYLLTVGADNVVQRRSVKLGAVFGTLRSITADLQPGERVIVNGLQSARPGAKVDPHQAPISTQFLDQQQQTADGSPTTQSLPETNPTDLPQLRSSPEARP